MKITRQLSEIGQGCNFNDKVTAINSDIAFNGYITVGHFMFTSKTYNKEYGAFSIKFSYYKII